jgi:RNA polymerase sigma-70 factor (ECF subfamily)
MRNTGFSRIMLVEALKRVSQQQREIVLLHDLEGWTHVEISDALNISQAASRWHLFYARRLMNKHLGTNGDEDSRKEARRGS